jgi:RNA polymerase sigma factor (sigma-70 family)
MTRYFDLSEQDLIRGCLNNDRKAQEQLYRMFADDMLVVCLAYESDPDEAKDILQNGFIKVFRSLDQYDNQGSIKGWIRRIIVNTAIDHYRKKKNTDGFVDIENIGDTGQGFDVTESKENVKEILELVERLPDRARLIFNLFALEGYSHKEIATQLNIAEGTSKSMYSRAKMLLQQWLEAS